MSKSTIGEKISTLRKKNGLSQKDLADKLCVSNKTVSKWECGNGDPDIDTLKKLSAIFGMSIDYLLDNETNDNMANNRIQSEPKHINTEKRSSNRKQIVSISLSIVATIIVVFLVCFFLIPRAPRIIESTNYIVDEEHSTINCTVDNDVSVFSIGGFNVPMLNKWQIYRDTTLGVMISDQTVSLQAGDNIFYLIVKNYAGQSKVYTLTIRRKPLYTVIFDTKGGENVLPKIIMEGEYLDVFTPTRDGYIFSSWDYDFNQPILGDTTITGNWIAKELSITYHSNNDNDEIKNQEVTYDSHISLFNYEAFSMVGYTLFAWNTKADGTGDEYFVGQDFSSYDIPNDIELYAQWTVSKYNLTAAPNFANAGTITGTGNFEYNSKQRLIANTNNGYSWLGWYDINDVLLTTKMQLEVVMQAQDEFYCAKWNKNSYVVTFDVNGGNALSHNDQTLIYDSSFSLPVPTRTEATFVGWYINDVQYTDSFGISVVDWNIASNVTVYAHWSINKYAVNLTSNNDKGGSIIGGGEKEYGSIVTLTANQNAGYTFTGWYQSNELISEDAILEFIMPNRQLDYTAKWKENTYNITFDVNGGTLLDANSQIVIFDGSYNLPTTSKVGYLFAGWCLDANGTGRQITDDVGNSISVWDIADDTTVYAKWNLINYKINYVLNGGQNNTSNPSTYNIEDPDIILNYPTKAGYNFNGWVISDATTEEKTIIISSGSIGDKTYAASWDRSSAFTAISTPQELQNIQNNPSGHYYLTQDINLSAFTWSPILEFSGIIDGNGFNIVDLSFTTNDILHIANSERLALIISNKGVIQNLGIKNVNISLGTNNSYASFAVLVVDNYGKIYNCCVDANINSYQGEWGIIAYNNLHFGGEIVNCSSSGLLDGSDVTAGGIVRVNGGVIKNCHSDMTLKPMANTYYQDVLAGICATNGSGVVGTYATIENCFFTGTIQNGYYQYGIAQNYGTHGSIKNCFVDAILGPTRDYAFGLSYTIGNVVDSLSLANCYYADSMVMPVNTEKTGTQVDSTKFYDKIWLKNTLGYKEFISEVQLWLDGSNVWIFGDNKYPQLYWERV